MTVSIRPFALDGFEALPAHIRGCVFWEVDPALIPSPGSGRSIDAQFDKEAWISMVMLDWGRCAQVAVDERRSRVVGTVFYAPPGRVPRAALFPTSPVSPDAVLITSVRVEPGFDGMAEALLDNAVTDLVRRGVRAVEAFGIVRSSVAGKQWDEPDEAIAAAAMSDLCAGCMIDAHFLKDAGFDLVAAHHRFPRFRLELHEGLGWKSAVENALDELVAIAAIEIAGRDRGKVPLPVGCSEPRWSRSGQ